jgi:serine/threonine-protein kinase
VSKDVEEGLSKRYRKGRRLGVGGMGEVVEYGDRRIGRRIALKISLPERKDREASQRRFIREVRLQGQLEHPSIVPVYDFGRDEDGNLFFTMKRVDGVTLKDVLRRRAAGDEETIKRFPRRKLLSAFVTVCQAVDYAHSRGVVHRDLKPANIMLGRFGEVYVLDWGIAKLIGTVDEVEIESASGPANETRAGTFIGTPGYAAPEQIAGAAVDGRSDVYALGTILFEILTLERLHEGGALTRMSSTIDGAEPRIASRAREHDLPPELEAVCLRATRPLPEDRFDSVRELHELVEAFLGGESNLQLRRELAEEHARTSERLASLALAGSTSLEERRRAMEEAGRALALEPTNDVASKTMMSLMTVEPAEEPSEVAVEIDREYRREIAESARVATLAFGSFLLFLPLLMWQGVRWWSPIIAIFSGFAISAIASYATYREPSPAKSLLVLTLGNAGAALASVLYGSLVLVPAMVAPQTVAFVMHMKREHRWYAVVSGCLAIAIPFALEVSGGVSAPYSFEGGAMMILPRAVELPAVPTLTVLMIASMCCVVFSVLATARVREELLRARRKLHIQSWHLRALFPGASAGEE